MIDLVVFLVLVAALVRVARVREAVLAMLVGLCAYLFAVDLVGALCAHIERLPPFHVLSVLFLGPTASPVRNAPAWLAPPLVAHVPSVYLRLATAALAAAAAQIAFRTSAKLRPESTRARQLDDAALALVTLAALNGVVVVVALLVTYLMGGP